MITTDKQQFIALAVELGYEVSSFTDDNGGGPMGNALVTNPDGSVTKTEITSMTFVKQTVYESK